MSSTGTESSHLDAFEQILRDAGLEVPPDLFADCVLPDEDDFPPSSVLPLPSDEQGFSASVRSFPFLDDELEFFAMQRYPLAETLPLRELKARIALHAHILFINVIVKQQLPETPLVCSLSDLQQDPLQY